MPGNKRKSNSSSDGSTKKQQIAAAITQNSAVFSIGNNNTTLVEKFDPKIIEKKLSIFQLKEDLDATILEILPEDDNENSEIESLPPLSVKQIRQISQVRVIAENIFLEIRAFISEISAKYKASYSESEQKFYCDEETVNQFEAELEEIYEQIEEILNNVSLLNGFLKPENKCRIQITGLTLPPCEEKYKFIFDHHIISQCVFGVSLTKASFYSTQFNRVTLSQESTIKAETALGIGNNNNSNNNNQNFPVDIGGRIKFGFESGMPEFFEDDSRTKWLAVAIELAAIAAITPKTYGKLLSNAQSLKILCPVLENIALSKKRWERLNEEKTALLLNSIDNLNSVDDRAAEAGQLSKKIDSIVNLIRDYEVFAAPSKHSLITALENAICRNLYEKLYDMTQDDTDLGELENEENLPVQLKNIELFLRNIIALPKIDESLKSSQYFFTRKEKTVLKENIELKVSLAIARGELKKSQAESKQLIEKLTQENPKPLSNEAQSMFG